jgi:serine/threonine protein kinase
VHFQPHSPPLATHQYSSPSLSFPNTKKPENFILTESGHLQVIDFGTAKDLVDTKLNGPEFVGTAEYMSPEAVNSKPVRTHWGRDNTPAPSGYIHLHLHPVPTSQHLLTGFVSLAGGCGG